MEQMSEKIKKSLSNTLYIFKVCSIVLATGPGMTDYTQLKYLKDLRMAAD